MDLSRKDLSSRLERLGFTGSLQWENTADLARMSMEAMNQQAGAPRGRSLGSLRLHGAGVEGNSGAFDAVGQAMSNWQRLVTSVAGAQAGHRGGRGRLPASIVSATQLNLVANPLPGSLILQFESHADPTEELGTDDVLEVFDKPETQQVDAAIEATFSLINEAAAHEELTEHDPVWISHLRDLGPRTASALSEWAKMTSAADFDVDLSWEQPNRPTRRASLTASDARAISESIRREEMDSETETIRGFIMTISDVSNIQVLSPNGDLINIKPGKIGHDDIASIRHGSEVELIVNAKYSRGFDEETRVTYTGVSIRALN